MLDQEETRTCQKSDDGPTLLSLPVEILIKIMEPLNFGDIQALRLTCVHLNRVTHSEQITSRTMLNFEGVLLADDVSPINHYLKSTKLYTTVSIQSCSIGILDKFFDKYGEHITSLTLKDLFMCDEQFIYILDKVPNLKTLQVNKLSFNLSCTQRTVEIPDRLPELHKLHLRNLCDIPTLISLIFPRTPDLKNLTIINSMLGYKSTDFSQNYCEPSTRKMLDLIDRLSPTLTDLNIVFSGFKFNTKSEILMRLKNLNLTKFSSPNILNYKQVASSFLSSQKNLIELDLSHADTHVTYDLVSLTNMLPMLQVLNVSSMDTITNHDVTSFLGLRNLKKLDISNCINVDSYGIMEGICRSRNETLTSLKMKSIKMLPDHVVVIAENLPNLQELDISDCNDGLESMGLKAIFSNLKHLTHLSIAISPCITDVDIIGENSDCIPNINDLKRLRFLDISDCKNITSKVWEHLTLPDLVELNIANHPYSCLNSIKMLLKNCPSLEKLTLTAIDSNAREQIFSFSKRLKHLIDTAGQYHKLKNCCMFNCCAKQEFKRKRIKT